jgi:hypothetical protein
MSSEELVDYAMPLMQIDTQARIIHDYCLNKQYMEALDHALQMELALVTLRRNLILMQLKEKK